MTLGGTTIMLTWNLFWQTAFFPLCLVVFAYWLKKHDKKREVEQRKQEETAKELEDLKERNYDEWRARFLDGLCAVKNDVKAFTTLIPTLITQKDCDDSHDIIKDILDVHGNRITVLEEKVKHFHKGKE